MRILPKQSVAFLTFIVETFSDHLDGLPPTFIIQFLEMLGVILLSSMMPVPAKTNEFRMTVCYQRVSVASSPQGKNKSSTTVKHHCLAKLRFCKDALQYYHEYLKLPRFKQFEKYLLYRITEKLIVKLMKMAYRGSKCLQLIFKLFIR